MSSPATTKATTSQPQAAVAMSVTNPQDKATSCEQGEGSACKHKHGKASRLRGAGAGKDCFLGLVGCFLCCECCEGCFDCIGDIICCPCEMCC